jgi:tetratricopeptide (TPR) repeat protein
VGKYLVSALRPGSGKPVYVLVLTLLVFLPVACKAPTQQYYSERGDEFLRKGDYENALAQYKLAVNTGKPNHRLYQSIARGHARLGQLDDAIDNYVSAARQLAKDGERVAAQIEMVQDRSEREYLVHVLNDRIKLYSSDVWYQLAMLFRTKEDDAKAVDALRESLQWVQGNLRARAELAMFLESKMDYAAAIKEWRRFIKETEKASVEERARYRIGKNEVAEARGRLNSLMARQSGAPPGEKKE